MTCTRFHFSLLILFIALCTAQCSKKVTSAKTNEKIGFDITFIDDQGLRRGEVAVEYEFCVPASDFLLDQVMRIEPAARVLKSSKGRIGCRENTWLVIISTHHPGWKERLYEIVGLEFVERVEEVFYE